MNLAERAVHDEDAAREWLEAMRWPNGPACPHCGEVGKVYRLPSPKGKRQVIKCAVCRKQFSVTVGTIFEDSHIPLHKWLMAFHLYCSSKKGMSAHQLHRTLKITYKSAWFMAHRIRYCMGESPLREKLAGIVEADEMYVGGKEKNKHLGKRNPKNLGGKGKAPVVALVQRGGHVRSFAADVTLNNLRSALTENVRTNSRVMTDSLNLYGFVTKPFASHETVDHAKEEYVRGDVHTNTVESVFAIFKRGVYGTFHHISKQHLHRYLAEFDFRYNNRARLGITDDKRTDIALKQSEGKRLTYRPPVTHQA
jgi:transposase-like protein